MLNHICRQYPVQGVFKPSLYMVPLVCMARMEKNTYQLCATVHRRVRWIHQPWNRHLLSVFHGTTGPACVVSMVFFAKAFFPDASVFSNFDADKAFEEYLKMAGWDDRTDISDIICYGPGHTTKPIWNFWGDPPPLFHTYCPDTKGMGLSSLFYLDGSCQWNGYFGYCW